MFIKGILRRLSFAFIVLVLGTMTVILAESECPQYGSLDSSCTDNLPSLASPLAGGSLSQRVIQGSFFGDSWPRTYCNNLPKKHVGIDLRANFQDPVYAVYDGTVSQVNPTSNWCTNWGSTIIIDHSGLFTTIYEHVVPESNIADNYPVKQGEIIGRIAEISVIPDRTKASDCDTVNHLHFGMRCGGYSEICKRGGLPEENGDGDYDPNTGRFTGCMCDPVFPGGFINPLDSRIIYEEPAAVMVATIGIPPIIDSGSLQQLKQNGDTITAGETITDMTAAFKATLIHPGGNSIKLQIELRRLDEYGGQFDDFAGGFKESDLVESGSEATTYAYGLIDGDYHWRARAVSEDGTASEWVDFGGNDLSGADFTVSSSTTSQNDQLMSEYSNLERESIENVSNVIDSYLSLNSDYVSSFTSFTSYDIVGAKSFDKPLDALLYMNDMGIASEETQKALAIIDTYGVGYTGFCIVIAKYNYELYEHEKSALTPAVCDEKGVPLEYNVLHGLLQCGGV